MTHFLVYWKPDTVAANVSSPSLDHSASNQYHRIAIGDVLWVVTSEEPGDLVLVGRQRVDRVVNQAEAERQTLTRNLWQAEYHAICDEPEPKLNLDISSRAHDLTFDSDRDRLPPDFTGQHLQTMRCLDEETAEMLESIWQLHRE
jgi:hypothetical protein